MRSVSVRTFVLTLLAVIVLFGTVAKVQANYLWREVYSPCGHVQALSITDSKIAVTCAGRDVIYIKEQ